MRFKLLFLILITVLILSLPTFGQEVRVIYFYPNDRNDREVPNTNIIDEQLHILIQRVCKLFQDQVGKPFNFEKYGNDKLKVHYFPGDHDSDSYRNNKGINGETIRDEIRNSKSELAQGMSNYLYLIAADLVPRNNNPTPQICGQANYLFEPHRLQRLWKKSTDAWAVIDVSQDCFFKIDKQDLDEASWKKRVWITAHELGHAFGLRHDFKNPNYIMSYGRDSNENFSPPNELSDCAVKWLKASRFFNRDPNRESDQKTKIESDSALIYSKDTEELNLRFSVTDDEGLHQVQFIVPLTDLDIKINTTHGKKLYGCSDILSGSKSELISFVYSDIQDYPINEIELQVMDTHGNIVRKEFTLTQAVNLTVDDPEMTINLAPRFAYMGSDLLTYLLGPHKRVIRSSISDDGKLKINPKASGTAEIKVTVSPTETPSGFGPIDYAACLYTGGCKIQHFYVTVTNPEKNKTPQAADSIVASPDSSSSNGITQDSRIRATLKGHTDFVSSIAFSPDGEKLVSGSWDNSIILWDPYTYKKIETGLHTNDVTSVTFSPDGQRIASAGADKVIRLWTRDATFLASTITDVTLGKYTSVVFINPFRPGDYRVAAANDLDGNIYFFDYDDNSSHWRANWSKIGMHATSSLAVSPDQSMLASGGTKRDSNVLLWDPYNNTIPKRLEGHTESVTSVAFSPDREILASGSKDNTVILWNIAAGTSTATLEGHTNRVLSVAFSPDGKTLASGSDDKTIRLWDVATGRQIDTLLGHTSGVTSLAFNPNRLTYMLASVGGYDQTVLLWDISPVPIPAPTIEIIPSEIESPAVGENLVVNIKISNVKNVAGYQLTVHFNPEALKFVKSENGSFFPDGYSAERNSDQIKLAAVNVSGNSTGDGTLATLTFSVVVVEPSQITLSDIIVMEKDFTIIPIVAKRCDIVVISEVKLDVNGDGVVNIKDLTFVAAHFDQVGQNKADVNDDNVVDIRDLLLVASRINSDAAAPSMAQLTFADLTAQDIQTWLSQTFQLELNDANHRKGIAVLQQLLAALTPKETVLLPNYPNPFNPETWIPYQLATPADVMVTIYAVDGTVVRTLALGHQSIGIYQGKNRAAYWDGKNALGEPVASGVYFYTLTAGEFAATRKMLIRK